MKTLALVLPNLQQLTAEPEPKNALSRTLQRGLTKADGKVTYLELQKAQEAHQQQLTPEVASSALSSLRSLNSWREVTREMVMDNPEYPNGVMTHRLVYQLPDQVSPKIIRDMLIDMIRPADKRLIMILLSQLMVEKPFFDADAEVIKYRLQQLASDLAALPYLAIWCGIDAIRTQSERRGFPETAEIIREVKSWADYISDAFMFFSLDKQAEHGTVESLQLTTNKGV